MFWGLNLKPNRKYTQSTIKAFHVSSAALDSTSSEGGNNQVFITYENEKYLICTLRKDACEQHPLDLNFAEGDEISFQSIGSGNVTLTGYLVELDSPMFDGQCDEPMGSQYAQQTYETIKKGGKQAEESDDDELEGKLAESDDDDDSDDEEEEDDESDDDSDEEEEEDEDDDEEEEIEEPKPKHFKPEKDVKENGVKEKGAQKGAKPNKKEKQQQQQKSQERVLSGGVKVIDLQDGNGPEIKAGKRAVVYYEGRLKSNNKTFDSTTKGPGFKFRLGGGEVIKAWDIGVAGMKVGGRRRITCPPHMAYGARGQPPTIPPNSTLVFDVTLKGIQ